MVERSICSVVGIYDWSGEVYARLTGYMIGRAKYMLGCRRMIGQAKYMLG
ncbi:hypothetical protein [Sporosarcina psychrophila]|uniref:Uncharacterized protein n=1 Tax=Sporosarcina psychrophila TaxID=1476 RepID=A0ABV2KEK9_SPOPS